MQSNRREADRSPEGPKRSGGGAKRLDGLLNGGYRPGGELRGDDGEVFRQAVERGEEAVPFSRAVVECRRDHIALVLGEALHGSALRQVLANESVGVFVRSPFPGVIRGGEVDLHAGGSLDLLVAVELRTVVDGDGFEQAGMRQNQLDHAFVERGNVPAAKLANQGGSAGTFDQGDDAMLAAGSEDGVHFPVTELAATLDGGGSRGDVAFAAHPPALLVTAVPFAPLVRLAKMAPELSAPSFVTPDVAVDRFMTDLEHAEQPQPAADLLGAELFSKQRGNQLPRGRAEPATASRTTAPPVRFLLGDAVAIGAVVMGGVALKLPADGAAVPAGQPADLGIGEALLPK